MLPYDRQKEIVGILRETGHVSIHRLAQLVHVSEPTLRRDLVQMEKQGLIRRTYGGAVLPTPLQDMPVSLRKEENAPAKKKVALEAVQLLHKGETIFIDSASTAQNMIDLLSDKQELTVVVNSISACQKLMEKHIRTYCVGGLIDANDDAMRGKYAEDFLRSIQIDQAFFSCSSLSPEGQLGGHNEQAVSFLQTLLPQTRRRIFLCTRNKMSRNCMHVICNLRDVDAVICDQPLPEELMQLVGQNR